MDQTPPSLPRRIGLDELRDTLADVLRQTREGASFLVTSEDGVLGILGPPPPEERSRRTLGLLRGRIWMALDWDEPDQDMLDAIEADIFPPREP